MNWTLHQRVVLGTALLVAATAVSCGDSSEHATQRTDGQPAVEGQAAPQTAVTQPAVPTTTTIPMLVAWIDESEPEDGPAPLAVKFVSMVKGGVPPYSYKWVFDDGSEPSTEAHPVHTYAEKGLYWPELYVTDTRGEEDDDTTVVEAR